MKNSSIIDKMVIGFYVSNTSGESTIEFGGYNPLYLKNNSEDDSLGLKYYSLYSSTWWQLPLTTSSYGSDSLS